MALPKKGTRTIRMDLRGMLERERQPGAVISTGFPEQFYVVITIDDKRGVACLQRCEPPKGKQ
jgi:hypothetical protein